MLRSTVRSQSLTALAPVLVATDCSSLGVVVNNSTIMNNQVTSIATISQELLLCSNFCFLSRNFKTYLIDVFKDIASLYREGSFAIVTSKLSVSNNTRLSSQR